MQKLYTPTVKRQATEMQPSVQPPPIQKASVPRSTQVTYAAAVTPVTPTYQGMDIQRTPAESTVVQQLQVKTQENTDVLTELRKVCASLAVTQQQMSSNMATMNNDMNVRFSELVSANLKFNDRFTEMSNAIESLRASSPTRPLKFHKEAPTHIDTINFHG